MNHAHAMVAETTLWQRGMDSRLVAYQEQLGNVFIGLKGALGPFYHHTAAMVATHDIHCDSHGKVRGRSRARGEIRLRQ